MDPKYAAIATLLNTSTAEAVTRGESASLGRMSNANITNIFTDLINLSQPTDDQRTQILTYIKAQLLAKLRISAFPTVDYNQVYNNMDLDFLSLANMKDPAQYTTEQIIQIMIYQWSVKQDFPTTTNEVVAAFCAGVITIFES